MRWVLDAAIEAGLVVRPRYNNRYTLAENDAVEPKNANGRTWALAGYTARIIPLGARVHASVRTRRDDAGGNYRPRLPDTTTWEGEPQWWGPPPRLGPDGDT